MAKKKNKAKKLKNSRSSVPESVTVAPEVNTADLDPKKVDKIQAAAAQAAAEAAAAEKEKTAAEKSEASKNAPKTAGNKAKKSKKNSGAPKKAAGKDGKSKNAKNAKGGKKKDNAFVRFWKELGAEMKKIRWTNGKDTVKNTLVVLLVILVIGIGVWIVDWLLVKARTGIYNAASPEDAKQALIMLKAAISCAGLTV